MRVIAGSARGRRLAAPKGSGTRPTSDRVREALFSMLAADIPDSRVLDLFAGTGALGIEALSRGAARAIFVEQSRRVAQTLRENLGVVPGADARVIQAGVEQALGTLRGETFDVVFLDPPYDAGLLEPTLDALADRGLVSPEGVVVCEHRRGTTVGAEALARWTFLETRTWGDTAATFLRPPPSERDPT